MLTESQKISLASLRVEIIDLNILAYFFVKKINRVGYLFQKTSREYLLEEFIALRYMENGLILHLTNLDDENSKYSFRVIHKTISSTFKDQKIIRKFNDKLDKYRRSVNSLKNKHRNLRIAHLNYDDDINFDEFLEFGKELKPLIIQANEIADLLWGEQISVKFKLGSQEGILDFRQLLDGLAIDMRKTEGFS